MYRKMGIIIGSLWFFITKSVMVLISLVDGLVVSLRRMRGGYGSTIERKEIANEENLLVTKREEEFASDDHDCVEKNEIWIEGKDVLEIEEKERVGRKEGSSSDDHEKEFNIKGEGSEDPPEFKNTGYEAHEKGETEDSSLCFKFEYQIPDYSVASEREIEEPDIEPKISSYSFLLEKDRSEFIKHAEAMTFKIHESCVPSSAASTAADKEEMIPTLLSTNNLKRKETSRNNSDAESFTQSILKVGSEDTLLFNKHVIAKAKLKCLETNFLCEKDAKILSSEFSGFDSDSESSLSDDGYSVKDLKVDSDGDDFSSERDFMENDRRSYTTGTSSNRFSIELLQDIPKLIARQFDDSLGDVVGGPSSVTSQIDYDEIFKGFLLYGNAYGHDKKSCKEFQSEISIHDRDGREKEVETNLQYSHSFDAELSRLSLGDVKAFSEDEKFRNLHEAWSDDGSCKAELTHKELVGEELQHLEVHRSNEMQSPTSSTYDIESMTDGDDGLFSLKSESFNMNSPDKNTAAKDLSGPKLDPDDSIQHLEESIKQLEKALLENEEDEPQCEHVVKKDKVKTKDFNTEDLDELESLWEHQDLIEQLKMDLKRARAIGLPTIMEESETPKTMDDLKPWKIDEIFLHEDPMDELHKFYKSYRERMRKFDILNYQKMYAMGFLQLKDPLQNLSCQKTQKLSSILSQNLWLFRRPKPSNDPSVRFIKELQSDLETVYVGQMCLSWEFLRWQYEKARDLPEPDPYRSHQYNQVAGEFQQFQVLVQRFIENENFQGPRLPYYVKTRCVLQSLLQVPVIREDCLKDMMEERRKGNDAIRSEALEIIMVEAIRLFWEFVKADKDAVPVNTVILKSYIATHVELHDPSDYELLVDAHEILLKKDKRLKDLLRTGNCIVRKFKKPQENRLNQDMFFSQVDLKLVARVIKMSRITSDQLVWCHKKLSKISFVDRKIQREPSFLLFPH